MAWVTKQTGEIGDIHSRNGSVFAEQFARNSNADNIAEYAKLLMKQRELEKEIEVNGTQEQKDAIDEMRRKRLEEEEAGGFCTVSGGRRRKTRRSKSRRR